MADPMGCWHAQAVHRALPFICHSTTDMIPWIKFSKSPSTPRTIVGMGYLFLYAVWQARSGQTLPWLNTTTLSISIYGTYLSDRSSALSEPLTSGYKWPDMVGYTTHTLHSYGKAPPSLGTGDTPVHCVHCPPAIHYNPTDTYTV